MRRSQKGLSSCRSLLRSLPDENTKRPDGINLTVVREGACKGSMGAQPCHVIESAITKTQHVIACRNYDDPGLFDAHGGNRHLGLISSCSHYFRPIGGWCFVHAGGGGDEILAAKGGCPFDARGNHCRENRARRRDESEHRFVWPRIVAEHRR